MTGPLLLPVCTFLRVFDTTPENEVLTLPELTAALRRFEVKLETAAKIEREVARIRQAQRGLEGGAAPRGKFMGKLAKAMDAARRAGEDPARALVEEAEQMVTEAYKSAKRDLRLWSPALYRPGADHRGAAGVTHVSCLVLDYDDGTSIREASTTWSAWFHLVYTTWSHRPDHPRFRLCMPLATPVAAEDWARVWSWAEAHAHFTIDPSMKSPAATYALPAVPHRDWPREAFSRPGAILDPVAEGIIARAPRLDLAPRRPPEGIPSAIRGEDPDKEYIDHVDPEAVYFVDEPWEEELDWEADPELVAAAKAAAGLMEVEPGPEVEPEPGPHVASEVASDAARWDAGVAARIAAALDALERRRVGSLVDALEAVVALHDRGAIDDAELAAAKARLFAEAPDEALEDVAHLVVDFDGVLHAYTSGWRGPTRIVDPPVDGAIAWLEEMSGRFPTAVRSVRSAYPGAIAAMRGWLSRHGLSDAALARLRFPVRAPRAFLVIDDRALRIEGELPRFDELGDLTPWNKG